MILILRWALNAVALMLIPELISSIQIQSYTGALMAALLIALANALIRPLLLLLTLPITVLTLGLFALVINALLFWGVSELLHGFSVGGFWSAMGGAIVYSLLTGLISLALSGKRSRR